jgi:predicted 3-demethylubiquinone-9 3-methyltransferase (glyoxalase superfamily)
MQKVYPCLLLNEDCEAAVNFYVSLFADSSVKYIQRYGPHMPLPEGEVLVIEFFIRGQQFIALNGPKTQFTDAVSLVISCDTQEEIDRYYDGLAANGGQAMPCGWVKDRFGVVWQIVWSDINSLFLNENKEASQRAFQSMMTMQKLEIAVLKKAFEGD